MTAGYSLFVDLFRDYFAWRPEEDDRARGERLAACLRVLVEQGGLSEERLDEMVPLLGHLLSLRFGTDWDDRLKNAGPEQIRHQTFLAVRDFLVALARRQPLVLVLEDLHWADSLSLDLISLLLEALPLAPLCLLCVYRPERDHKCWHLGTIVARKCLERYTEIHLRELTPPQSRRLVESLLGIENLPAAVRELILAKSRGNPFFVEEVVRALIASGMVYREGECWRAREEIETISVPESIQSVIASRVDRLRPELQQVLQSASVIGRLFRPRLLEAVVGVQAFRRSGLQGETSEPLDAPGARPPPLSAAQPRRGSPAPERLNACLWELEEQDLVYQERVVPEEEYSFKHVLTQETIYQGILRRRRPLLHQRVGEAIEALYPGRLEEHVEQLAYHYERSGADEKAVEYLLKAGEKARRAYLNDEAIGCFQRALDRLDQSPPGKARNDRQVDGLQGLGRTYLGVGSAADAEGPLRQAIDIGRKAGLEPARLARLHYWLGDTLFWLFRHDEIASIAEAGLALVGENSESVESVLLRFTLCLGRRTQEEWHGFVAHVAPFIRRLPYSEDLRAAYGLVARIDGSSAEAWDRHVEQLARRHHHLRALADVHLRAAGRLAAAGALREAIPEYQHAVQVYERIGDAKHKIWPLDRIAQLLVSLGEIDTSEQYAAAFLVLAESSGSPPNAAGAHYMSGLFSLCRQMPQTALEAFLKAHHLAPHAIGVLEGLGRAYLALGRRGEAFQSFQEALARLHSGSPDLDFPACLANLLCALEEACEDPAAFQDYGRRLRRERPEVDATSLIQWFLEPARPHPLPQHRVVEEFRQALSSHWHWQDPFQDCAIAVENGLEIRASNGRDLQRPNQSAPRLLQRTRGEFAVETVCTPACDEKPAMGGLLLWLDEGNYLRLHWGTRGPYAISFQGCLGGRNVIFGRGRLHPERIYLRLERRGSRVNALCSTDGESWFTVGHAEFPVEDPVEVGLHAIGSIDRSIDHDAYPEGTAIRFESFDLWTESE